MSNNSFIIAVDGLSIFLNGKPHTIDNTHPNFSAIKAAICVADWSAVSKLLNLSQTVKKYVSSNPDVVVDTNASTITYKGESIHNSMVVRILDMMNEGFPIEPMIKLLVNLYNNVSMKTIDEMYTFLEYGKMPITEDGHFLAYKRVNNDYTSCYDNKTTNNIGEITTLPRHKVDDKSEITCSYGLHICSFDYLRYYPGDRVIIVKVNPADVVSIPTDYNNTKARVCRYEVIGELTPEEAGLTSHSFGTSVYVEKSDESHKCEAVIEDSLNNLSEQNIKELFELSTTDEFAEIDAIRVLLQNKIKVSAQQQSDDLFGDEPFGTAFGGPELSNPEDIHPQQVEPSISDWFKIGYTKGYFGGVNKHEIYPEATLEDDETGTMTIQNIIDLNVGYATGYKDGRGHKRRQYPITK